MSGWRKAVAIGSFVADRDGSDFRTCSLTGWDDGAPVRISIEEKAQQDGGWDSVPLHGPRVIGVNGRVEQASRAAALAVIDELNALSLASLHEVVVDDPNQGSTRSALARVSAAAVVEWVSPVGFTYTAQLTAPDHVKYGPLAFGQTTLASSGGGTGRVWPRVWPTDWGVPPGVTPGAIMVANAGTASYFPRLRIDGPVTNPVVSLVETGDTVRFNGVIAAGQHLDINWGTPRRVTIGDNPVSMRHKVTYSGNFLAVPVGGGSISYSADDADPAAVLSVWSYEGAWE